MFRNSFILKGIVAAVLVLLIYTCFVPITIGNIRKIGDVSENIREFAQNRMNHKACEAITWASSLSGGLGLNSGGGQGMVHGIGHGISANWGTHHGLANMVVAVPVSRYNLPSCPERFAEMAQFMGIDTRGMTRIQAGEKWLEEAISYSPPKVKIYDLFLFADKLLEGDERMEWVKYARREVLRKFGNCSDEGADEFSWLKLDDL